MQPKKKLLERAKKDGATDKINRLVSAAYILISEAYLLHCDAEDELYKYGLQIGETKFLLMAVKRTMQKYFDEIKKLVSSEEQKNYYFSDLDKFDNHIHDWFGLDKYKEAK